MFTGFILGVITLYSLYYFFYNSLNSRFQDTRLIGSYRCDIRSDKDIDVDGDLNIKLVNKNLYEFEISHGRFFKTRVWFAPQKVKLIMDQLSKEKL